MQQLFFMDAETPIAELIAYAQANPIDLSLDDVRLAGTPEAASDEIFSPQLLPYDEWVATTPVDDELGLFEAGSLNFVDSDVREALLASASKFSKEGILVDANGHPIDPEKLKPRQAIAAEDVDQSGLLGVRLDSDGYAIVEIDLHEYKNRLGSKVADLVVCLPRSIDGTPVVRIAGGAFRARLVNGISVRLVAVPDSVAHIRRDAFAPLAVNDIFISRSVQAIEPQEFNAKTATVRADRISFHVDPRNPAYAAHDGSLYTRDGKTLLFQAYPYDRELTLPEGLERIEAGAFVRNTPGPEVVHCPSTLARVDSKPTPDRLWNPETLWECPHDSELSRSLSSLRPITIAPGFVREEPGFFYDITPEGEAHLARSPRACERVVLPREVDGHPLTHIREGALPKRLTGLVIPPTVRSIGQNNLCTGLEELTLPDGIREIGPSCFRSRKLAGTVRIPVSLTNIGRGCFENALCRFDACGVTVQVSPNLQLSCFTGDAGAAVQDDPERDGIPFDFAAYDAYLTSSHHVPDRLGAILLRVQAPYRLAEEARKNLLAWLRQNEEKAVERIGRIGDPHLLDCLCELGFITEETIDRQAEMLRRMHRTDAVLFLMDYRQKHFGAAQQQSLQDRFAL